MDRIDISLQVVRVPFQKLTSLKFGADDRHDVIHDKILLPTDVESGLHVTFVLPARLIVIRAATQRRGTATWECLGMSGTRPHVRFHQLWRRVTAKLLTASGTPKMSTAMSE